MKYCTAVEFLFTVVLVVWRICHTMQARILLLPISQNSHILYFGQLGTGLVGEGHSVSMMVPTNAKVPSFLTEEGVQVFKYQGEETQFASSKTVNDFMIKMALTDSYFEQAKLLFSLMQSDSQPVIHLNIDCEGLLNDTKLMNMIQSAFDFAVLDPVYPHCYYSILYKYGIPYASFSLPLISQLFRVPKLPSQVPSLSYECSDAMSFSDRLVNTFTEYIATLIVKHMYQHNYVRKVAPEMPFITTEELVQRSKLAFFLQDPVIDFPQPSMPNTLFVADIMARKAKPLPDDLELFMSRSNHGVVMLSFGSMMDSIPKKQSTIIFEAVADLKQHIIMKISSDVPDKISQNSKIKIMKWLPQNDLLAHPNLKVFISHAGINSFIEALSHGVPILAIPLFGDQFRNAFLVEHHGLGKRLKFGKFSSNQLKLAVESIIDNQTFSLTAKRMSQIFLDKSETAASRASHMINHVIKYGDSHLRTKSFHINSLQLFMLDIYVFLFLCFVIAAVFGYFCLKICCRCVLRQSNCSGRNKEKRE